MKPKLKVLILDDEYPARKELRYHLEQYNHIQVVGEAANAIEALELINAVDYSVVFMDIDMPGESGLQLGEKLRSNDNGPAIIFVTAHDDFALEAFSVNALDYVLKPINPDRLAKAVEKLEQQFSAKSNKEIIQEPVVTQEQDNSLDIIPVENNGKTLLVNQKDILFFHANNDYTYLKTESKKFLTRFTLKELENRLTNTQFFRCHRSYLINLKKIKEVIPLYNGTLVLIVNDQESSEVPVSRAQVKKVRNLLGL